MTADQTEQSWTTIAKIAAWLAGLIGIFLVRPPHLHSINPGPDVWLYASQFVLAVLLGLFFLAPSARRILPRRWRMVALIALGVGLVLFLAYQILLPLWSCAVDWRWDPVVKGSILSPTAARIAQTIPTDSCGQLMVRMGSDNWKVWPEHELITRYLGLCVLNSLAILSFAFAAMATIEYMRTSAEPSGGRRRN